MWYATGNTVVVPTFEDAKRLAFGSSERLQCKVVSANDASVISKSGAITGLHHPGSDVFHRGTGGGGGPPFRYAPSPRRV